MKVRDQARPVQITTQSAKKQAAGACRSSSLLARSNWSLNRAQTLKNRPTFSTAVRQLGGAHTLNLQGKLPCPSSLELSLLCRKYYSSTIQDAATIEEYSRSSRPPKRLLPQSGTFLFFFFFPVDFSPKRRKSHLNLPYYSSSAVETTVTTAMAKATTDMASLNNPPRIPSQNLRLST